MSSWPFVAALALALALPGGNIRACSCATRPLLGMLLLLLATLLARADMARRNI